MDANTLAFIEELEAKVAPSASVPIIPVKEWGEE